MGKAQDTPGKFPQWSEARLREMAEAEDEALSATEGLLACSPELYAEMEKTVRQKFADGVSCGHAGCLSHVSHPCEGCGRVGGYRRQDGGIGDEIDYADQERYLDMKRNNKNQLEGADAVEGKGEAGQDRRGGGRGADGAESGWGQSGIREAGAGVQEPSVGDTIPIRHDDPHIQPASARNVDLQALKDICGGKIPQAQEKINSDPNEVDLCGFKSFNDVDGEWYMCCKEKHPYPKVKHGDWQKI
ncbi:unnamed protein product [Sphagnum balticum]